MAAWTWCNVQNKNCSALWLGHFPNGLTYSTKSFESSQDQLLHSRGWDRRVGISGCLLREGAGVGAIFGKTCCLINCPFPEKESASIRVLDTFPCSTSASALLSVPGSRSMSDPVLWLAFPSSYLILSKSPSHCNTVWARAPIAIRFSLMYQMVVVCSEWHNFRTLLSSMRGCPVLIRCFLFASSTMVTMHLQESVHKTRRSGLIPVQFHRCVTRVPMEPCANGFPSIVTNKWCSSDDSTTIRRMFRMYTLTNSCNSSSMVTMASPSICRLCLGTNITKHRRNPESRLTCLKCSMVAVSGGLGWVPHETASHAMRSSRALTNWKSPSHLAVLKNRDSASNHRRFQEGLKSSFVNCRSHSFK